ncbi:hypothetical protein [Nocardia brasiliensis]|uniref:hypothetical protein n=1 Tax=Nocardia brasiliensis TaxID=37326 RepID=UPI0033C58E79
MSAENIRPDFDRHAFATAGLAFIESPERTDAGRVRDAVHAYLYTVANIRDRMYPSWNEVREYLAQVPR